MLHFTARVRCPMCSREFSIGVTAADKIEADEKTHSDRIHEVRCPHHGGPLRFRGIVLHRVEAAVPTLVATAVVPIEQEPPKRPWWQFWG
jgi:hypothetical protein